jgi:hypothetical protein
VPPPSHRVPPPADGDPRPARAAGPPTAPLPAASPPPAGRHRADRPGRVPLGRRLVPPDRYPGARRLGDAPGDGFELDDPGGSPWALAAYVVLVVLLVVGLLLGLPLLLT